MSEKDFDWNDDLDFESLADEKEMTADYGEPGDSYSDFEDLSDSPETVGDVSGKDAGLAGPGISADEADVPLPENAESEPAKATVAAMPSPAEQKVVSPGGLGFLVTACTLVGAVGLGGALLLASGLEPASLWQPEGLMAFDQIFDFQANPFNLVYLVGVGVLLLALGAASVAARSARQANARVHASEKLLASVTTLRLDDEEAWTANKFKGHPEVSAFVTDILGAWRLQQARQVRSVGLEGELRRLDKALRDESRNDLADRYDHPLVGSLADAMVNWYDDRDAARKETASVRDKDALDSAEVMGLIQDARSWNQASRQKIDVQSSTLKRWATRFEEMAVKFDQDAGPSAVVASLQGMQKELARQVDKGEAGSQANLDDLVERGSKLAFQIAMEVARLGSRGERLLPMSQALEEFTTEFRQAVSQSRSSEGQGTTNPQALLTRLEQITVQLVKQGSGGDGQVGRTLHDLSPASHKLAGHLEEISASFGQQTHRLNNMGTTFGAMAGLEFNAEEVQEGEPVNPPEGGLNISQSDPFGKDQQDAELQPTLEVDPFGGSDQAPAAPAVPLINTGISTDVTPGQEGSFSRDGFERTVDFRSNAQDLPEKNTPVKDTELPREEEKVYDLAEFGAVRIDGEDHGQAADENEDRVYDLAEFGAVALN